MAETELALENKRLRKIGRQGQQYLRSCISANVQLIGNNTDLWMILRVVRDHWTFRFLPKAVRARILFECGRAR